MNRNSLVQYYDRRAAGYEEMYRQDNPVRQAELDSMATAVQQLLTNRSVLEVACGTGYWTAIAAEVATHVVATDSSTKMLHLAREKGLDSRKVAFHEGDAFDLRCVPGTFDAGLANFWLSHVPKAELDRFLTGFHEKLESGAVVFMNDNVFIPGIGGELITDDKTQDSYKLRTLSDGSRFEVLKNFYSAEELARIFQGIATKIDVNVGKYFWWISYEVV